MFKKAYDPADGYEKEEIAYINSLPKCEVCGEPIDAYYYKIDNEILCFECMCEKYRYNSDDYTEDDYYEED